MPNMYIEEKEMRYIELTLVAGEKIFLAVSAICSVMKYDGNAKSIITCMNGVQYPVLDTYDDIILKIAESWGDMYKWQLNR